MSEISCNEYPDLSRTEQYTAILRRVYITFGISDPVNPTECVILLRSFTIHPISFVMLVSGFKKERGELCHREQQIQEQLEAAQRFQGGFELFKEFWKGQGEVSVLKRDIVGQFIDWIAVYPADRSVKPYRQKIEIYYQFIGKVELE